MPESANRLSDDARPDLDALLNLLLPHAQDLVRKYGEFYPFGAMMTAEGEATLQAAYDGDEHPSSQDLIDLLVAGMRQAAQAGRIRASAVCLDTRVVPPGQGNKIDAICVRIEHHTGEAAAAYLPYRKGFLGRIRFGELFADRGEREVFGGDP